VWGGKVSRLTRSQGLRVIQGVKVSRFKGCEVSRFRGCHVSRLHGFRIKIVHDFRVSGLPGFTSLGGQKSSISEAKYPQSQKPEILKFPVQFNHRRRKDLRLLLQNPAQKGLASAAAKPGAERTCVCCCKTHLLAKSSFSSRESFSTSKRLKSFETTGPWRRTLDQAPNSLLGAPRCLTGRAISTWF